MRKDNDVKTGVEADETTELVRQGEFLKSLEKWSHAVIGVALFGGPAGVPPGEAGWVNTAGRWVNVHGGRSIAETTGSPGGIA